MKFMDMEFQGFLVVISMGNPWVFFPIPDPYPLITHTCPRGMGTATVAESRPEGPPIPIPVAGNPQVYY